MSDLYSICEKCGGSRKLIEDVQSRGSFLPAGTLCPFCGTGYNRVGMTEKQLEALLEERDELLHLLQSLTDLEREEKEREKPPTDDQVADTFERYRRLWQAIRDKLKRHGARIEDYRRRKGITGRAPIPLELPPVPSRPDDKPV